MSSKPPGRPKGTTLSPKKLLEREMRETAKMNANARTLLSEQIEAVREAIKNATTIKERLEIIETLTASLEKQGKVLDSVAKHLLKDGESGESGQGEPLTGEDILRQMTGGRS